MMEKNGKEISPVKRFQHILRRKQMEELYLI